MKTKEIIDEITKFPPFNKRDVIIPGDPIPGVAPVDSDRLYKIIANRRPFVGDFYISLLEGDGVLAYLSNNDNRLIGYASIDFLEDEDTMKINAIFIRKEYRGMKLGYNMYKYLMKHYKKPVQTDIAQTREGQKLWVNLANDSEVKVVGFVDIVNFYFKGLQKDLKKIGAEPYKPLGPKHFRYLFPVRNLPVLKRLGAEQQSNIIKLYYGNEEVDGADGILDTGMLAFLK